ncbi:MAG: T9SS type A sorting domain-containing protein [Lewinellaceae bacterium]|nr:T9SS type A sorting domain-containing protein [Lewinellaceae bacterium]
MGTSQEPPSCGADLYRDWYRQQYPELQEQAAEWQESMAQWAARYEESLHPRTLITIPVVVHVVYKDEPQNISQEQIESQLEVLNADYRAANSNLDIVPPIFQNLIADVGIEFCLAAQDPEGKFTTGITRQATAKDNIGIDTDVHYTDKGGADAWDPLHYLNIWVADMGDNIVGRATFPGEAPLAEDGVVIDPRYFGTTGLAAGSDPYHLGRTTVHEIGHYLNLLHPWGSALPDCAGDDGVLDTPQTDEDYLLECPTTLQASCGSLDMYTNFMYYTNDACLAQFTPGQKVRILATLAGPRLGLTLSAGCLPSAVGAKAVPEFSLSIRPNPSAGQVVFELLGKEGQDGRLQIFDSVGKVLYEEKISTGQVRSLKVPAQWADGVYGVRVQTENGIFAERWILMRSK